MKYAHVLPSSALLQCHLDSSGDITSEKPNASNIHKSDIISKNIGKETVVYNLDENESNNDIIFFSTPKATYDNSFESPTQFDLSDFLTPVRPVQSSFTRNL